ETVLERLRGVAVGDAAGDLVEAEKAEPDGDLQAEIGPASGQVSAAGCDEGDHRTCSRAGIWILTRRLAVFIPFIPRCRTSRPWPGRPSAPSGSPSSDPCAVPRSGRFPGAAPPRTRPPGRVPAGRGRGLRTGRCTGVPPPTGGRACSRRRRAVSP